MTTTIHIIGGKGTGGAEGFYVRLVNALQHAGHAPVAVTVAGGAVAAALDPAVRQWHVPMMGNWDLWSRWRIARVIARQGPCIVQTYMGRATRLTHLRPDGGTTHIARLGGFYSPKGYRHAHVWVGNTLGVCDYLVEHGFPRERVFHIGNFVAMPPSAPAEVLAALRAELGVPTSALVLLAVGRLHPVKGFADLLAAFAHIPARCAGRPVHLVIVGDGPLAGSLRAQAATLPCRERLHWAGWRSDPAAFYDLADIVVMPSHHETLGNVILEAWAHARPVLASCSQGPLELCEPEHDAVLAPVANIEALASGAMRLLNDGSLRAELARAGHAKLKARFSEQAVLNAYLALYERLRAG